MKTVDKCQRFFLSYLIVARLAFDATLPYQNQ